MKPSILIVEDEFAVARISADGIRVQPLPVADFSVGTSFAVGQVSAAPAVHWIVAGDDNAFALSPIHAARSKVWVGTTLGSFGSVDMARGEGTLMSKMRASSGWRPNGRCSWRA